MKTPGIAFALMLVLVAGSPAGPNEGGILVVHGNTLGVDPTHVGICEAWPVPETCEELVPRAIPDPYGNEWFYIIAACEPEPLSFNTIVFGVGDYDPSACYIWGYGPCFGEFGPLEIPSTAWPGPNSGTAVSWAPFCLEGTLVPIYVFAIYTYGPEQIPLGDFYPGSSSSFISCTDPPEEDPIADFGTIGCGGADGENPCPEGPTATERTTWGLIKAIYR